MLEARALFAARANSPLNQRINYDIAVRCGIMNKRFVDVCDPFSKLNREAIYLSAMW